MDRKQNAKLLISLAVIFLFFHWTADLLGSGRGEFGVVIAVLITALVLFAEALIFKRSLGDSAVSVGLGKPAIMGVGAGLLVAGLLFLSAPLFTLLTGTQFTFYPGWLLLSVGMFFQGGIAEEVLFRGFLFGRYREKYSFWKAAAASSVPFVIVHFLLLLYMPWMIAAASILLAVVTSFPLARLFELGGRTIWPPAIVHFAIQAGVKLLVAEGEAASIYPLYWMAACAIVPWVVFLIPVKQVTRQQGQ